MTNHIQYELEEIYVYLEMDDGDYERFTISELDEIYISPGVSVRGIAILNDRREGKINTLDIEKVKAYRPEIVRSLRCGNALNKHPDITLEILAH